MKVFLDKHLDVENYDNWVTLTVNKHFTDYDKSLRQELVTELVQRDQLGSLQIAERVILPHIIDSSLAESVIVISQLNEPILYRTNVEITTGIYILARQNEPSITKIINRLIDESVILTLQSSRLTLDEVQHILT
ncbi:PTS sugar transporter subunit IIA [Limosilactobacillus caecicola]|uniref:PTS sugar transporter subunit IIA n=1 Tax=Limosilactobacillus caecicola TaxID=2941332 RepID=UPI00203E267D|nr:PTS sugar transporter subunit IIA [Limosilactobacillus caecicola]